MLSLFALLDSGSAGNYISSSLVSILSIPVVKLAIPVSVKAVNGCHMTENPVTLITQPLQLTTQNTYSSMSSHTPSPQWCSRYHGYISKIP